MIITNAGIELESRLRSAACDGRSNVYEPPASALMPEAVIRKDGLEFHPWSKVRYAHPFTIPSRYTIDRKKHKHGCYTRFVSYGWTTSNGMLVDSYAHRVFFSLAVVTISPDTKSASTTNGFANSLIYRRMKANIFESVDLHQLDPQVFKRNCNANAVEPKHIDYLLKRYIQSKPGAIIRRLMRLEKEFEAVTGINIGRDHEFR